METFVPVTQFNFDPEDMVLEENSGEVVTVPDQALSLEEIWRRSQAGTLPDIVLAPVYDENPAFENAIKPDFDLTDIDATQSLIDALTAQVEAQKAEAAKASAEVKASPENE